MQETIFSAAKHLPWAIDTDRVLRYLEGLDAEALAYVRETWPEAELADLRCSASDVLNVRRDERTCAECRGTGSCPIGRHPMVLSAEWIRGRRVYVARAGKCGAPSAQDAEKGAELEKLLEGSGLSERQRKQTFEAYVTKGMGREIVEAKARALLAATEGHWLVLAGNRGTGKSHLAVAIMLEVMRRGEAAMFRCVPEMLDELRSGNEDDTYHAKMKRLKEVPCLVLDDLGKERNTDAGTEYLYQILDFRYRNEKQTIVTTNAATRNKLVEWSKTDYFVPLLSRLNEMGAWCAIQKAADYRSVVLHATHKLPMEG